MIRNRCDWLVDIDLCYTGGPVGTSRDLGPWCLCFLQLYLARTKLCSEWSTALARDHDVACSSLVLYGIRATIKGPLSPCMEATYPLCHKEPEKSKQNTPKCNGGILRSKAPSRGLWMRRAGSLWHKRAGVAIPRIYPRHRGGPLYKI